MFDMDPIYVAEWTAFLCSFFLLKRGNDQRLQILTVALAIEILTETLAAYYSRFHANNHLFYIISTPLVNSIYALTITRAIGKPGNKRLAGQLLMGFWLFVLVNFLFIQGTERYNSYTSIAATAMLCSLTFLYYRELVQADRIIRLRTTPLFWICAALMLLGLPRSVFWAVFEYMVFSEHLVKDFGSTFQLVNQWLCIIFYLLMSFAFVCRLLFRSAAGLTRVTDPPPSPTFAACTSSRKAWASIFLKMRTSAGRSCPRCMSVLLRICWK